MNLFKILCLAVFILALPLINCSGSNSIDVSNLNLPAISDFYETPADLFFIQEADMAKISRAIPYLGSGTSCAHPGAHVHFTNSEAPYTVDIVAPFAGVISDVTTCLDIGTSDRYGVDLIFATNGDDNVAMHFSIEPLDGHHCSDADDDPEFYSQYILVTEGEEVAKGQVLARMVKFDNNDDGTHIHFDLNNGSHCPNVFNQTITDAFQAVYGESTCNGVELPATFCYEPSDGEDLVGL